jgi:hypothetical protein
MWGSDLVLWMCSLIGCISWLTVFEVMWCMWLLDQNIWCQCESQNSLCLCNLAWQFSRLWWLCSWGSGLRMRSRTPCQSIVGTFQEPDTFLVLSHLDFFGGELFVIIEKINLLQIGSVYNVSTYSPDLGQICSGLIWWRSQIKESGSLVPEEYLLCQQEITCHFLITPCNF